MKANVTLQRGACDVGPLSSFRLLSWGTVCSWKELMFQVSHSRAHLGTLWEPLSKRSLYMKVTGEPRSAMDHRPGEAVLMQRQPRRKQTKRWSERKGREWNVSSGSVICLALGYLGISQ